MILNVYSVRDSKADTFSPPFFNATHGIAERNFQNLVNDPQSQVNRYPTDFDLYYLGKYDDNTGKFESLDTPQHQMKAVQLLNQQPAQT